MFNLNNVCCFSYVWYIHLQCKAGGTYYPNDNSNIHHTEGSVDEFEFLLTQKTGNLNNNKRIFCEF